MKSVLCLAWVHFLSYTWIAIDRNARLKIPDVLQILPCVNVSPGKCSGKLLFSFFSGKNDYKLPTELRKMLSTQHSDLAVLFCVLPFCSKRNQHSLEEHLILGLEQEIYKMTLEHLTVPESKEALKTNKQKTKQNNKTKRP